MPETQHALQETLDNPSKLGDIVMSNTLTGRCMLSLFTSIALSGLLATSGCSSSSASAGADAGGGVGSGGSGGSGGAGTCPPLPVPAMPIHAPIIHLGYDGTNEFIGPVLGNFTPDSYASNNNSVATIEAFGDCNLLPTNPSPVTDVVPKVVALVHSKSAGNAVVTIKLGNQSFDVNVVVEKFTPEVVALGKKRYYEPDQPSATRKPCAMCHSQANGPDHSPAAIAYLDDAIVRSIATKGTFPACIDESVGSECTCGQPLCTPIPAERRVLNVPGGHTWDFTPAELAAIVPYLRSLPLRTR